MMQSKKQFVLSVAFGVLGCLASISTLAAVTEEKVFVQKVHVDKDDAGAHIVIDINGDKFERSVSIEQLKDSDALHELLADVPEDKQGHIIKILENIGEHGKQIKIINGEDIDVDKVIVFETDEDIEIVHDDADVKVIKKVLRTGDDHKVIQIRKGGHGGADAILHLLSKGKFNQDQLDKIQQALDEKR